MSPEPEKSNQRASLIDAGFPLILLVVSPALGALMAIGGDARDVVSFVCFALSLLIGIGLAELSVIQRRGWSPVFRVFGAILALVAGAMTAFHPPGSADDRLKAGILCGITIALAVVAVSLAFASIRDAVRR